VSQIIRRLGVSPRRSREHKWCGTCPDIFELSDGNFAIIGTDVTDSLDSRLPADAARADYERIVVITRETLVSAKADIPTPERPVCEGRPGAPHDPAGLTAVRVPAPPPAPGPTYRAAGRMIFESSACSTTFAPPHHPRSRERRSEHLPRQTAQFHDQPRVELDVRVEFAARLEFREDRLDLALDLDGELDPRAAELLGDLAQHPGTGVLRAVDRVAEAHDAVAGEDAFPDPGVDTVRGADRVQGVQGTTGRTPVQRTRECPYGPDQTGRHIRPGRRDDPRGEG
jgi:hypothetical protein